jgi:DNA-directed RNA polymerase specialized sigma24 family protein
MGYRGARGVSVGQVTEITPALTRYAESSQTPGWEPADLVQETIARLLEVRGRLEIATLFAYALSTLNNLSRAGRKSADIAARNQHRLVSPAGAAASDERLLLDERRGALRVALQALPSDVSELLRSHYADGEAVSAVSPATSARLSRGRARLRVEYLLALRRVTLPTPRCHSVLVALSERNTRRQAEIGAGRHLLTCRTCSDLADPLLSRQSRLFGLAPLGATAWLRHAVKAHPAVSATSAAAVGVAAGAIIIATHSSGPNPSPPQPEAASPLCRLAGPEGASMIGQTVGARDVVVAAVPADEGFFVVTCRDRRVWIELLGQGESPERIRPGHLVSFSGTAVALSPRTISQQQVPGRTRSVLRKAAVAVRVRDSAIRQSAS